MIDKNTIKQVAAISRLRLTKEEITSFKSDFVEVLEIFHLIDSADVSQISDKADNLCVHSEKITKNYRKDVPDDKKLKERALKLSKNSKDGFFKGPRCFE